MTPILVQLHAMLIRAAGMIASFMRRHRGHVDG
jgi:hypothetical protein